MSISNHCKRWTAGLLLAALAVTTLAPAAEAKHGRGRGRGHESYRYKGDYSSSCAPQRQAYYGGRTRYIERRHSDVGPAIAGFIGGLAVGTIIAQNSQPAYAYPAAYPADDYDFYDPYCGERYSSYSSCSSHYRGGCSHPRVILVISESSGQCVDTYRYRNGSWSDYDYANYDERWDGGYYGNRHGGCDDD